MPEITSCPECQRKLQVPEELRGQSVKCPSCAAVFTVRADTPAAAPAPPRLEQEAKAAPVTALPRSQRDDDYDDERLDDEDYPRRRRRRSAHLEPHRGSAILTVGILSLVILGIILGPIAWVMGSGDLRKIREGRMDPEGEGMTKAGMICGIIATCLNIACCSIYGLLIAAGGFRAFR